jgi:hypothetical protein
MKANALFPIMEGIVSTTGAGSNPYAQSVTTWLRAAKEVINLAARMVENDFLFYVTEGINDTEDPIGSDGDAWIYAALVRSKEDVAHSVYLLDAVDATAYVPGTTAPAATIYPGAVMNLPAAASTSTPVVFGQVYTPYNFFTLGVQVVSVDTSDQSTGSTAAYVNIYTFHRNE